jgi:ATP-dependent DNA helicase RecQ
MGERPVLALTPTAIPLLKGEESLTLAKARTRIAPVKKERKRAAAPSTERGQVTGGDAGFSQDDEALFESLRALRREIADREEVPAYVVFHDATLWDMVAKRPGTPEELLEVTGVGVKKAEKYGDEFVALLNGDGG